MNYLDVSIVRAQSKKAKNHTELRKAQQAMVGNGCSHDHHPDPEMIDLVIRENVLHQAERCKRSPIIKNAVDSGQVLIVPCVYNIDTGEVEILKSTFSNTFSSERVQSCAQLHA